MNGFLSRFEGSMDFAYGVFKNHRPRRVPKIGCHPNFRGRLFQSRVYERALFCHETNALNLDP
jgi:hypothetical protein